MSKMKEIEAARLVEGLINDPPVFEHHLTWSQKMGQIPMVLYDLSVLTLW